MPVKYISVNELSVAERIDFGLHGSVEREDGTTYTPWNVDANGIAWLQRADGSRPGRTIRGDKPDARGVSALVETEVFGTDAHGNRILLGTRMLPAKLYISGAPVTIEGGSNDDA